MSALTAPYDAKRQDSQIRRYPIAAATEVFKGGLAAVDLATGFVQPAADSPGLAFVGVFAESIDNLSGATQPGSITPSIGSPVPGTAAGAAGAFAARVYKSGDFLYNAAAATAPTDLGKQVFIHDDNTVGLTSTNSLSAGYVTQVVDAGHYRVRINRAVG